MSSGSAIGRSFVAKNIFVFGDSPALMELVLMHSKRYGQSKWLYDAFVVDPSMADILMVFGPVSFKQVGVLKNVYQQMANPKRVVAIGTTPLFDGYNLVKDISQVIPVDYYFSNLYPSPADFQSLIDKCLVGSAR